MRRRRAAPPRLGGALEFMRLLWAVDHALQRTSKRMETTLGVTGPQRLVIRIVGRFPRIPAGRLARFLHIHPSTLTGILKRLGRQGMIRQVPDSEDGRRSLLILTTRGQRLNVESEGTVESGIRRALVGMAPSRLAAARAALERIAASLEPQSERSMTVSAR
jgi:MarR family transcriptional regulator, organic hydroperoxide resistance regulator